MDVWHIRDFDASDLDQAVRVWDASAEDGGAPLFLVAEVIEALLGGEPAVVAIGDGRVVGHLRREGHR